MSASTADILRGAGFVPVVPVRGYTAGTAQTQVRSRVPVVPVAPVENGKADIGAARDAATDTAAMRGRLLALAAAKYRDAELVRSLGEAFLRECHGFTDAQLSALLSMLADDAERKAGRVPKGDTAAILCRSCGPVWTHPSIARVLPVVGSWPRALGCPWCFIRARRIAIPRPHVRCCDCRHRIPGTINPAQGMGRCAAGNESATWPGMAHRCADFRPMEGTS